LLNKYAVEVIGPCSTSKVLNEILFFPFEILNFFLIRFALRMGL